MQRCPKCGYNEGTDWFRILGVISVGLLYVIYTISADSTPKSWRLIGLFAYLTFMAGGLWRGIKDKRNRDEYLKLHPSPPQSGRDHPTAELPATH
jgi:hypothetical protein